MAKQKPCEECKHYEKCCYYGGWTDAQWIGVKDRLQKRGEKVLVYMNFSQYPEFGFANEICDNTYKGKLVGTKKDVWAWQGDYVTHWMPRSEPPQEVDDRSFFDAAVFESGVMT